MQNKTQFRNIDGKKMAYWDIGNPKNPAMLLGHSFLWDKQMWAPQIEALSANYRLIVPDLWSHGESDNPPENNTTIKKLADDAWQLMQSLNIHEFSVIGLSVGGMWGTQLAIDHAENITGLVLIATHVGCEPEASKAGFMELIAQVKKDGGFRDTLIENLFPVFFSHTLDKHSSFCDQLKNNLARIKSEQLPNILEMGKNIFNRECRLEKLADLPMPIAIIVGEDDVARPPHESEEMARYANTDQLYIVKNAGHICNLEKSSEITEILQNFLKTCQKVAIE